MDVNEKVKALEAENKVLKDFVDNLNAEKIALDQLLVDALKGSLEAKKQIILRDSKIQRHTQEVDVLKKEIQALEAQLEDKKKIVELNAPECGATNDACA